MTDGPAFYPSTPLFFPADPNFCFMSYFSFIDGGIYRTPKAKDPEDGQQYEDVHVNESKLIADFHDVEYWEQISTNGVFTVYWNIDTQILLITDCEAAWESEFISLLTISKSEREELLVSWADDLIKFLLSTLDAEEREKAHPHPVLFQMV